MSIETATLNLKGTASFRGKPLGFMARAEGYVYNGNLSPTVWIRVYFDRDPYQEEGHEAVIQKIMDDVSMVARSHFYREQLSGVEKRLMH